VSIYNAIINSGSQAGAGFADYARNKYSVQQDRMRNEAAMEERDYNRSRNVIADRRLEEERGARQVDQAREFKLEGMRKAAVLPPEQREAALRAWQAFGVQNGIQGADEPFDMAELNPLLDAMAQNESGRGLPAEVQTFQTMTEGLPDGDRDRARRIALGLDPRAMGNANITLASGDAGVTPEQVGQAAGTVAGAVRGAQEGAEIAAIPARAEAERGVAARAEIGQIRDKANESLKVIRSLRDHEGLDYLVGRFGISPVIPGTAQADAAAFLDQIQGRAFLEAFESLKGGGQITEIEGRKATDAIARLGRRQTKKAFQESLDELMGVIESGLQRAERAAGVDSDEYDRMREELLRK
jgi:hypothetical protein